MTTTTNEFGDSLIILILISFFVFVSLPSVLTIILYRQLTEDKRWVPIFLIVLFVLGVFIFSSKMLQPEQETQLFIGVITVLTAANLGVWLFQRTKTTEAIK